MLKLTMFIPIGIWLVAFAACKQAQPTVDISTVLSNGQWVITDITSDTATPPPTLFINTAVNFEHGGLELSGPCNQIGGFYEVDDVGKVTRSEVHMTLKNCNSEDEQEVILLRYFNESNHLSLDGDNLVMHSLPGAIHFRRADADDNSANSELSVTATKPAQLLALLLGELAVVDDCLRVNDRDSATRYLLVWPPDFKISLKADSVTVINEQGDETVLYLGEMARLSGGELQTIDQFDARTGQNLPAHCSGPYWVVGDTYRSIKNVGID